MPEWIGLDWVNCLSTSAHRPAADGASPGRIFLPALGGPFILEAVAGLALTPLFRDLALASCLPC